MIRKAITGLVLWYVGSIVYDRLPAKYKLFSKGSGSAE